MDEKGQITATTASGKGGNINLNLKSDLILRNNSLIDSEALGTGNGGNIAINSPVIAGFENSDIIANAIQGNGGNIDTFENTPLRTKQVADCSGASS